MGRMASHSNNRHAGSATNTSTSLTDIHRERGSERSKTTNSRASPYNEPVRLRNACDPCHQLKRKCSGDMPCENCTLSNSTDLCLYRPVNRLGRPRGSRNRQKTSTQSKTNSKPQQQQRRLPASERHQIPTPPTTDPMPFSLESLEHSTTDDMNWDSLLDEGLLTLSSRATTDMGIDTLAPTDLDQHMSSCQSSTRSSYSNISNTIFGTFQDQPCHEQCVHRQPVLEWPQSCSSSPIMPHLGGSPTDSRLQNHGNTNKNTRQRIDSVTSPCHCAQSLRTLLTSLGRSNSLSTTSGQQHLPERPLYPIDTVLSNATRALEQWSAFELCSSCSSTSCDEKIENTFLLAFLSVQCVLGQLRSLNCLESDGNMSTADATCVRVGTFDVTGQKRTSVLGMLRVTVAREVESAIEALRFKIHDPCGMSEGRSGGGLLAQIDVMFQDLALDIRTLQQQQKGILGAV